MSESAIMNPALKDFWLTQSRFKVLYGGRDSSKSWDAAANSVRIANEVPIKILCTRMFQNRIEDSVYSTIKTQIMRFDLGSRFRILKNRIINKFTGSEYIFYGIARNLDEIKSLDSVDILWIEEAHNLTKDMWEILEPTIRKDHSEIWIVFNPKLATDFAYQRFVVNPPPKTVIRKINYDENIFLSDVSRDTIMRIKEESYEDYLHIYGGVPRTDDDTVIIKRSWIQASIDAHIKLGLPVMGVKRLGYDPADGNEFGTSDANAYAFRHGSVLLDSEEWIAGEDQLLESCQRVYNVARQVSAKIIYDSIGVGAGSGSKFAELNESLQIDIDYDSFDAGGAVLDQNKEYQHGILNKDHFSNAKAQAWWLLADRFRNTYDAVTKGSLVEGKDLIFISSYCSNLDKIIEELSTPKRKYDGSGRVQVESKKDMKKRGVKSPNLADAIVMAFAKEDFGKRSGTF